MLFSHYKNSPILPPKFYLKDPKQKEPTLIFYTFHIFGLRCRKSTGIKVSPLYWNKKQSRVRNSHPEVDQINDFLDNLIDRSNKAKLDFITSMITPNKEEFLDRVFNVQKVQAFDLHDKFQEFILKKAKTRIVYQQAWNSLLSFDPKIKKIDSKTLDNFTEYLLNKDYSPNYIAKNVGNIIRFCKFLGIQIDLKRQVKRKKTDSIAINLEDLQLILKSEMPSVSMDQVKDLFIFSCFTGLRYSDLQAFKPSFIQEIEGVKCLVFYAKKTGNKSVIPLFKEAQAILSKYSGDLPKRISGQKFNEYLKEVCRLSGLTQLVLVTKLRADSKEVLQLQKYEAISSHTGRRSYITIMSIMGLTAKEISLMTGHTQQSIVDIYDKSKAEANAVKVFHNLKGRI